MSNFLHPAGILLSLILFPIFFGSCSLFDKDEAIPTYVAIDSISFSTDYVNEGSASHKISDAWVFVDDQLIGTFELPCKFPVITSEGDHSIKVKAGIKMNGIASTRLAYPFYTFYSSTASLQPMKITKVNPVVNYYSGLTFNWLEDFEGAGYSLIDTFATAKIKLVSNPLAFEGSKSMHVKLNKDTLDFQARSSSSYTLTADGKSKFIELNYKCNSSFMVGIVFNNVTIPVVGLNPSDTWNKVYINLTDQISITGKYYVYIAMQKVPGITYDPELYIDNIKLINN